MRFLQHAFDDAKRRAVLCFTTVALAIFEIRNEKLRDLVVGGAGGSGGGSRGAVKMVDDAHGNGEVQGLEWCRVDSLSRALGVLSLGLAAARRQGGVDAPAGSDGDDGRAHVVVQVSVRVEHKLHTEGEAGPLCTEGRLMLVDLAGSDVGLVGELGSREAGPGSPDRTGAPHGDKDKGKVAAVDAKAAQKSLAALQEVLMGLSSRGFGPGAASSSPGGVCAGGGAGSGQPLRIPVRSSLLTRLVAVRWSLVEACHCFFARAWRRVSFRRRITGR